MVFSSNIFLFFFLPAVLLVYRLSPHSWHNAVLLLFSLIFYAWGEPAYVLLMLFVILMNYAGGILLSRFRNNATKKKSAAVLTVVVDLLLLAFFKYAAFITESLNAILPPGYRLPVPGIPLPIGISFYIFQSIAYILDVYRGDAPEQRNIIWFGTYIAMFPQLIAGPIVRYKDIAFQLENRDESLSYFAEGIELFVIGLAKKVLLANRMGALFEALKGGGGSLSAWVAMFAYTLQIYFDFSGYSDMAIGLGKMFGFSFLRNFDYPYISRSITEFWRRWHISLGTWFREYVYIPLGGNRRGLLRQILNILIVWSLTGLWHGASWNFVLWGLYYALLLILEKVWLGARMKKLCAPLSVSLVFLLVSFGWVLFSFTDLGEMGVFISRLFLGKADSPHELNLVLAYLPLMLTGLLAATPFPSSLYHKADGTKIQLPLRLSALLLVFLLCVASLAAKSYNPFIYFRF